MAKMHDVRHSYCANRKAIYGFAILHYKEKTDICEDSLCMVEWTIP